MGIAIITKWIGPTNTKGSRVKASCEKGSVTLNWTYDLDVKGNHHRAAMALADKLGMVGNWTAGELKDGYAFVALEP